MRADSADESSRAHLNLQIGAQWLGNAAWWSQRVFEILGAQTGRLEVPAAVLLYGEQCYHYAWHAELWTDRLPALREFDATTVLGPPSAEAEAFVALLNQIPGSDVGARRSASVALAATHRVLLPRLLGAYRAHQARCSPLSDGPTLRALKLAITDLRADWEAGELLLQQLMRDHQPGDTSDASATADLIVTYTRQLEHAAAKCGSDLIWSDPSVD